MRKFIFRILIFFVVIISLILFILSQANGYTDEFYIRFTTPLQENLILGTSRAAQSLQPDVFKEEMNLNIYNYAFTIAHSPYGPVYLESIKKKINPKTKNGLFIITVDPWSISSETSNDNNLDDFRESSLCVGTTIRVDAKPNFQYLIKNLSGEYYTILLKSLGGKYHDSFSLHKPLYLHDNGWLEVTTDMDSLSIKKRTDNRIKLYREDDSMRLKYSSLRFEYLKNTILFLQNHGDVYLVRLPIHRELIEIEDNYMPKFNEMMIDVSQLTNGYFDMTPLNEQYVYIDGNHIHKDSGEKLSKDIISWIKLQSIKNEI